MVKVIKKKSYWRSFSEIIKSQLFLPFFLLWFLIGTLPVIYLVSQTQIDIRQRAETHISGTIVSSTYPANNPVLVNNNIFLFLGIFVFLSIMGFSILLNWYSKKLPVESS